MVGIIQAGDEITADIISAIAPLCVIKSADESVTSSTTLQNDNQLLLPLLVANTTYKFECYLDYEGGTAGSSDLKWTWSVPSGATLRYQASFVNISGNQQVATTLKDTDTGIAETATAGVLKAVLMVGTLLVGSTTGTLQLQWAQNTSSGTATIVHAQSELTLWRIT